jgi:bacillithiol biosynthesis deacetylase BshB1
VTVDVVAIGPHPDDVEVGIGALVHKLVHRGFKVAILDLTAGELGSRGTAAEREKESEAAAEILGVVARKNVGLPDSGLENADEQRRAIVPFLREWRPSLILASMSDDRHPDHEAAHVLVRDANYISGLAKIETRQEPHRAPHLMYYRVYKDPSPPQCVIDVSAHFEKQIEALQAHRSQFYNPSYEGPQTYVSSKSFWEGIRLRAAYWGSRIGTEYATPLYATSPIIMDLPPGLEENI